MPKRAKLNKTEQTVIEPNEELLRQVRGHVTAAAQLLKPLGPDKERIGWLLEDVLSYLDEREEQDGRFEKASDLRSLVALDCDEKCRAS